MITAKDVRHWHKQVSEARGRKVTGFELAIELGVTPEWLATIRNRGVPAISERRMALAMAAILAGLEPWKAAA